jgi:hypothetical protein
MVYCSQDDITRQSTADTQRHSFLTPGRAVTILVKRRDSQFKDRIADQTGKMFNSGIFQG